MGIYLFIYNIIQYLLLLLTWPLILLVVLLTPKYRGRTLARLGWGLAAKLARLPSGRRCFWVHALSVGEVSSVVALVQALRNRYPDGLIVFSTTTRSGALFARQRLAHQVDCFIPFPFDHLAVVRYFLRQVDPALFILVETDFWPNFLATMAGQRGKMVLVNGRISAATFNKYRYFPLFFKNLFACFDLLATQTRGDARRLIDLGIPASQVKVLGNLKIDAAMPNQDGRKTVTRKQLNLPENQRLLVAGSTHEGEESILLTAYQSLRCQFSDIFLVLALRDGDRSSAVAQLAAELGLRTVCRSKGIELTGDEDLLLVDTIGELIDYYQQAQLVFVGGSLVAKGGHNPLEPAAFACPVSFGPHMEDFADIAREMVAEGAAVQLADGDELITYWSSLLTDSRMCGKAGEQAKAFISSRQGITNRHLAAIHDLLP